VTASATPTRAASSATAHAAAPETATHTSTEAGPAAKGMLVYHAAVVESAECAGVAAQLHVRRDESAIGSMVEYSGSIALRATPKIILMTSKPSAETESVPVVDKGGTPGDKRIVIENDDSVPPVAAPRVPCPTKRPSEGKPYSERDDRRQPRVLGRNPDKLLTVRRTQSRDHIAVDKRYPDS
jgi:hypothetical protein